MSFLGRNGTSSTAGGINTERIEMAVTELDTVTDFFNRMVSSCHGKCISTRYAEADLNKGEAVCVDRCIAKFSEVQKKVGEKLQNRGANQTNVGPGSFGTL